VPRTTEVRNGHRADIRVKMVTQFRLMKVRTFPIRALTTKPPRISYTHLSNYLKTIAGRHHTVHVYLKTIAGRKHTVHVYLKTMAGRHHTVHVYLKTIAGRHHTVHVSLDNKISLMTGLAVSDIPRPCFTAPLDTQKQSRMTAVRTFTSVSKSNKKKTYKSSVTGRGRL
jgi:hypothetical protein